MDEMNLYRTHEVCPETAYTSLECSSDRHPVKEKREIVCSNLAIIYPDFRVI